MALPFLFIPESLRGKYSARVRWTPEFEEWQRFLEEKVGAGALEVPSKAIFDPSPWEL
jgi:hypothetical protein